MLQGYRLSSSAAALWRGDEQKPIAGGANQGERASDREALAPKRRSVDPALVQGQPMNLTWEDLASHLNG